MDDDLKQYVETLASLWPNGLTPIGWLYTNIFDCVVSKGYAVKRGGTYFITEKGDALLLGFDHLVGNEHG